MSQESINRQLQAQRESQLKKDLDALRCTILTEMHGDKWRIHGMGPKLIEGKPSLVTLVKEFDKMEDMLLDLPRVAAEFYNVVPPTVLNAPQSR